MLGHRIHPPQIAPDTASLTATVANPPCCEATRRRCGHSVGMTIIGSKPTIAPHDHSVKACDAQVLLREAHRQPGEGAALEGDVATLACFQNELEQSQGFGVTTLSNMPCGVHSMAVVGIAAAL